MYTSKLNVEFTGVRAVGADLLNSIRRRWWKVGVGVIISLTKLANPELCFISNQSTGINVYFA
jgi:hypothetical protein